MKYVEGGGGGGGGGGGEGRGRVIYDIIVRSKIYTQRSLIVSYLVL